MPERLVSQVSGKQLETNAAESPDKIKEKQPVPSKESREEQVVQQSDESKVVLHEEIGKTWDQKYREKVVEINKNLEEKTEVLSKPKESEGNKGKIEQAVGKGAVNVVPPTPSPTPEQKAAAEGLEEFKKSWLGSIVGLFGGEKAEDKLKEAYAGKGFWGFIGTLMGMTALSKGIDALAGKNPKAKQYIDQGKGFFKGFLDKLGFGNWIATEISKDTFEKTVQSVAQSGEKEYFAKSNYKFSEEAFVPNNANLVLMKDEKSPLTITAAGNMEIFVGEVKKPLTKGETAVSDKSTIILPAGTRIPAGTQFAEGFKIVVAPKVAKPETAAAPETQVVPPVASDADKRETTPESPVS